VRWETERPFDGQLCRKYEYQKLLKLDNSSSSYGTKNFGVFFMPHRVRIGLTTSITAIYIHVN